MLRVLRASGVALLALAASCAAKPAPAPVPGTGLTLKVAASGLERPLYLAAPAGDPRLFIVEQPGRIRIVKDGRLLPEPFLDITADVSSGGERGLLSVAFHPDYARNGRFFVDFTDRNGDTRIERIRASADPDRADPASRTLVLGIPQPYANHNGGLVMFGPDGMLYIGMGDGGSGGDPHGNGQNRAALLGKLLRIDVDHGTPYANPRDNPFVDHAPWRPEIWAWGLRNPWRFCFDPTEHQLYIADVGQNRWEELDVADDRRAGLNYGWNKMEGAHCFRVPFCDTTGLMPPMLEYGHDQGCSIIGGFVYRGRALPELAGRYFYAEYCSGWVRSVRVKQGRVGEQRQWRLPHVTEILSFGMDAAGELYLCCGDGKVYQLVRA